MRILTRLVLGMALLATPALAQTPQTTPTYTNQAGVEVPAQGTFSVGGSTYYTESTTALGASATFTGSTRATGMAPRTGIPQWARHAWFVAEVWTDQAGTLFVEKSVDGAQTWRPVNGTAGTAVAAGTTVTVPARVTAYQYRVRFVNGGTAQTAFLLTAALTNS